MIRLLAILICAVFTFSTAYAQDAKKKKETVTFFVRGMDCANCVKKIEKNICFRERGDRSQVRSEHPYGGRYLSCG